MSNDEREPGDDDAADAVGTSGGTQGPGDDESADGEGSARGATEDAATGLETGNASRPDEAGPEEGTDAAALGFFERVGDVWRNPAYRFVLLFLPYLAVVSVAYPLFVRHYNPVIQWFILKTAQLEGVLFSLFGADTKVHEKLVFFGHFAVKIIDECTGIYEMLIFAAAVMAFPTDLARKAIGVVLGCPLIYLFNVLRIAVLMIVGRYWPFAFDFMHLYFWQATMIVMITSVWLLWIIVVVRTENEEVAAPNPA